MRSPSERKQPLVAISRWITVAIGWTLLASAGGPTARASGPDADTVAPPVVPGPAIVSAAVAREGGPAELAAVSPDRSTGHGTVLGSRSTAAFTACDQVDFGLVQAGTGVSRSIHGALRASAPGIEIEAGPAAARTVWRLDLESDVTRAIDLDLRFSVESAASHAYYAIRLDNRVLVCGEASDAELRPTSASEASDAGLSSTSGRLTTAVRSLELPLDERLLSPGHHVLEALVSRGGSDPASAWLTVGDVRLTIPGDEVLVDPCRPLPPEDLLEIADGSSTQQRWIFDDNKYCAAGPGINCARGGVNPNPLMSFADSTDRSFEMYVVADCGTEMHVPLFDVESGCISVSHEDPLPPNARTPVAITVSNSAGFSQTGGEVCWGASDCGGVNQPGGPGDTNTMDVRFEGAPTLCGVFVVTFRSWGGCIWDLFANCNGSSAEQFQIFDNLCQARATVNPLPELVLENLTTADHGSCEVNWCVDVHNIGCVQAAPTILRAQNGSGGGTQDVAVAGLLAGATTTLCGSLPVAGHGPGIVTTVSVTVDPSNTLAECSESSSASSCSPAQGGDTLSRAQVLDCNAPPSCDAGGPYVAECMAASGGTHVPLDGTASLDPDGAQLTYAWTTDCPGGSFDDATAPLPLLTVPGAQCDATCHVSLTVTDPQAASASCTSTVSIGDTQAPAVTERHDDLYCLWPPNHSYVCFTPEMLLPAVRDNCSGATWSIVGCTSDQCDQAPCAEHPGQNGDGNTTQDCVILPQGQGVCVRSERAGTEPAGRRYGLVAAAVDDCGNTGPGVPIGNIYVPHDQSPRERACLNATKVGCHPNASLPCAHK